MFAGNHAVENRGAGGSTPAVTAMVDLLEIGHQRLYNRYTDVILATAGAFADRDDGGNVGFGVLRNFVTTFDLADHTLFLERSHNFDDGRFRQRTESFGVPHRS